MKRRRSANAGVKANFIGHFRGMVKCGWSSPSPLRSAMRRPGGAVDGSSPRQLRPAGGRIRLACANQPVRNPGADHCRRRTEPYLAGYPRPTDTVHQCGACRLCGSFASRFLGNGCQSEPRVHGGAGAPTLETEPQDRALISGRHNWPKPGPVSARCLPTPNGHKCPNPAAHAEFRPIPSCHKACVESCGPLRHAPHRGAQRLSHIR